MSFIFDDTLNLLNRGEFNFNQSYVGLSADKSTAIYGAPWNNDSQGVVYMFIHDGTYWEHQSTLTASDGAMGDWFGGSVSLSSDGSTALVGTWGKSSRTGAAYIFTRSGSTWTQQSKLTASDAATDDRFGYSVSLSSDGSCAAIEDKYGKVYVYTLRDGVWLEKHVKGNQSMKLSQLTNINRSQFCIYMDNVQVRDFTTHATGIDAFMWNDEKIVFEDQNLTSPVGTPEGAMMYNATDVDGVKVRVDVKTEKVAYEDELDL